MDLLDDLHLLAHVTGVSRRVDGDVATTTLWWWRLARAAAGPAFGRLSTQLSASAARDLLMTIIATVDRRVLVPDLRSLLPAAAGLAETHRLNLLSAEALAAAASLDARIVVATDNPPLRRAAGATGLRYAVLAPG